MLFLRVYAPPDAVAGVLTALRQRAGVEHVMTVGSSDDGVTLVTADVRPQLVDELLPSIAACGVPGDEIEISQNTASRPLGRADPGDMAAWSGGALAWSDLTKRSRPYARAVPQYLVYMVCAGVVAVFGVLTSNPILIVGAMAISPDLLPMCATCVGIVDHHPRLAVRAFLALLIGLTVASLSAFVTAAILRASGYPPANGSLGDGGLGLLPSVDASTVVVAFAAGVAGLLSYETRSSSAIGVAISITTIPAAAFAGAAVAVHDRAGAIGAVEVLLANIAVLILSGCATLQAQRLYRRRRT